jgi:hypothetical protein
MTRIGLGMTSAWPRAGPIRGIMARESSRPAVGPPESSGGTAADGTGGTPGSHLWLDRAKPKMLSFSKRSLRCSELVPPRACCRGFRSPLLPSDRAARRPCARGGPPRHASSKSPLHFTRMLVHRDRRGRST